MILVTGAAGFIGYHVALAKYDAVLVSTPHTAFKDQALYRQVRLVVDTRNIVERRAGGPVVVRA